MGLDPQRQFVHSLNCFYTNVDSILNKRLEINHILVQEHPDIFLISEVLPKNVRDTVQISELQFDDYACFTNCFHSNCHLGVAIYVKNYLNAQEVSLSLEHSSARECVWAEIKLAQGDCMLIGCVYRPPSNSAEQNTKLYESIISVINGYSHILIAGDFNHPSVDWKNESTTLNEKNDSYIFMEFVRDTFLFQHVMNPTHYRGTQKPTLIDLIFSNEAEMVKNVRHEAPVGKSHHQRILFEFVCNAQTNQNNKESFHNYKKANYVQMKQYINEKALTDQIENMNTEDSWNFIAGSILEAVEESVPKVTPSNKDNRKKPKWFKDCNVEKIKKKSSDYHKWLRTQDPDDWNRYAKSRNQSKSACRKADIEYQKQIAKDAKVKPKMFYAYTNSRLKVREGISDLIDKDGNKVQSDKGKADLLNDFFCSVFTEERTNDIPNCDATDSSTFLGSIEFTKEKVLKKLKNIDSSKSGGPDGIRANVLKELAEELSEPLACLFSKSMAEGKLPATWKDANVTPLFKKGDKTRTNNYRPVSLTSLLCKIMEAIIRDELVSYLQRENFLSNLQHGFISKRSCVTNLLSTLDDWTELLDSGSPVDVIYLDFSKAFDSVPHLRLLEKLKIYGICDDLLKWIGDFLIGRRQRVNVNGSYSEWSPVTSGVPQGSVLGPVLFVAFINDLPDVVESLCKLYADDTKLYSNVENIELREQIQKDLDCLVDWADKWQLRFNADKCHVLHLGFNNCHHPYFMRKHDSTDKVELSTTDVEKDLGVQVDKDLSFANHIQCQANKGNKLVGLIRRTFTHLDKETMKLLFVAMVRPHLEFANVAWSPQLNKDIDIIEAVQRRATKIIPGMTNMTYTERLKLMKLPSLKY